MLGAGDVPFGDVVVDAALQLLRAHLQRRVTALGPLQFEQRRKGWEQTDRAASHAHASRAGPIVNDVLVPGQQTRGGPGFLRVSGCYWIPAGLILVPEYCLRPALNQKRSTGAPHRRARARAAWCVRRPRRRPRSRWLSLSAALSERWPVPLARSPCRRSRPAIEREQDRVSCHRGCAWPGVPSVAQHRQRRASCAARVV